MGSSETSIAIAYEILSGKDVKEEDIRNAAPFFQAFSDSPNDAYLEALIRVWRHNPEIFFLVSLGNKLAGCMVIIPLQANYLQEWAEGLHQDDFDLCAFPEMTICDYKDSGMRSVLIELMAADPNCSRTEIISYLMDAFAGLLLDLAKKDIYINRVYTEAYNREGARLASFFGMQKQRETINGAIYQTAHTPDKLIAFFPEKFSELNELYFKKFHSFKF